MFNPNKSFFQLKSFQVTLGLLLLLSALSAFFIATSVDLKLSLTFDGFNNFISFFKFPLSILTLSIPCFALIAANHRSEQTKEQIRVTTNQNDFSNYYKHIEEFGKYHSHFDRTDKFTLSLNIRYLHSIIFDQSKNGIYEPNTGFISELTSYAHELLNLLAVIENRDNPNDENKFSEFKSKQKDFHNKYNISLPQWSKRNSMFTLGIPENFYEVFSSIINLVLEVDYIYKFNTDYVQSIEVSDLLKLDLLEYKNPQHEDEMRSAFNKFVEELKTT